MARIGTAAILETALRDIDPDDRLVNGFALQGWRITSVETTDDLALADLRHPALSRMGLTPESLSAAPPRHYGCTRRDGGRGAVGTAAGTGVLRATSGPEPLWVDQEPTRLIRELAALLELHVER